MADDLAGDWWEADSTLNAEESVDEEGVELEPEPTAARATKRKAIPDAGGAASEGDTAAIKKKKKKKKNKKTDSQPREYARHQAATRLIASGAAGCSEYIRGILQTEGKLADLELDDLDLEASKFSTSQHFERTGDVAQLGDFVKEVKRLKQNGSPRVLVIASGAIRCTHIIKALHSVADGSPVAKLFAKHMKLEEQAAFLAGKKFLFAAGTPNRILKLLDQDGLSLQQTRLVVLDCTWKDAKNRNLFDVPEIRNDMITLLSKHLLVPSDEKLEVALF